MATSSSTRRMIGRIEERSSRQGRSLAGCKSPHRQLPVFGRLAYPMRGEATNRVLLGRKSPGCPAGVFAGYSGARSISIPTRGLPGQKPAAPTSQEWDSWTACRALRDASDRRGARWPVACRRYDRPAHLPRGAVMGQTMPNAREMTCARQTTAPRQRRVVSEPLGIVRRAA